MAPKVPMTIRLENDDVEVLSLIAEMRRTTLAELARDEIVRGMEKLLDPARIEAEIEAEKQKQLEQAKKLRNNRSSANSNHPAHETRLETAVSAASGRVLNFQIYT